MPAAPTPTTLPHWPAPDAASAAGGAAPVVSPAAKAPEGMTPAATAAAGMTPAETAAPQAPPPATAPGRTDVSLPKRPLVTPDGIPKMVRPVEGRMLGGVAVGVAQHLKLSTVWVRAVFAILGVFAGAGVVAYALLWIFVPQGADDGQRTRPTTRLERRQAIGIAALGLALAILGGGLGLGRWVGWILGPLGLAVIGGAFIWREADEGRRARWRRTAAGLVAPARGAWWRMVGGASLVVTGLIIFAVGQLDFTAIRSALLAVILTLVGVGIITVPWWVRLVRDLGEERRGRIQEKERAEIAAHLHDSVLQTLALIQRQSADPREVQRLARSQERELRSWLYGPAGYTTAVGAPGTVDTGTLSAALAQAAGDVEDTYAIKVTTVMVGDVVMDPEVAALVAAAREAMVNAAKHSGAAEISLFAEVDGKDVEVFVRDRGVGFDPAEVGTDRRGLAESVHGRMTRHGGRATVTSRPGEGTEVVLSVSVRSGRDQTGPVSLTKQQSTENQSTAGTTEQKAARDNSGR